MAEYGLGSRGFTGNRSPDGRMIDAINAHADQINPQWTSWVPILSNQFGDTTTAISKTGSYITLNKKILFFNLQILNLTAGTGPQLFVTPPIRITGLTKHFPVFTGMDLFGLYPLLVWSTTGNTNQINILKYDGTTAINVNADIRISGFYEISI